MAAKKHVRWSAAVTHGSNALDLQNGVFKGNNPRWIALSLKRSGEHSDRRKASPFQSAMSMLNFYINRAGSRLSTRKKNILTHAKEKLRREFHKPTLWPIENENHVSGETSGLSKALSRREGNEVIDAGAT
jgi:hypothetical protein